jgi:hypothetical protein
MTSLIKVDSIQTAAGGTPTASSLGIGGVGKIGQVVNSTYTTETATTSSTFSDTGHSASITPSSTSSKVLVLLTYRFGVYRPNNGGKDLGYGIRFVRDTTNIYSLDGAGTRAFYSFIETAMAMDTRQVSHINFLDSPSSTSSLNYKVQHNTYQAAGCTGTYARHSTLCTLTLMEVLA